MNILAYVHLRAIYGSTGAGRVARSMIEELHRANEHAIKVLGDANDHQAAIRKVGAPWNSYDYRLFDRDTSAQQARWFLLNRPKAEEFWRDADLIYCTTESYVPTRRAPLVVTAHDAAYFETGAHREDRSTKMQALKWRLLYRKWAREADRVVTVSQFSAQRIGHYFPGLKDRLRVVPNGVPQRFFEPVSATGESALAAIGLKDRPFVLVPGGLLYRKNADLILRAWPLLRQMHPDLLLVVTTQYEKGYLEQAQALGPSVRLIGFVDDELLRSLYASAAVVWLPSLYEGFGIPVLEAMACGAPVVASCTTALPEIAGNAATLVPPTSVEDNVEAIDSLLRMPALAERQVAAGRRRAHEFTWTAAAAKLTAEFRALM